MGKITVNGISLNYQTIGKGPDIVMVHGLAANLAFWYIKVVPLLAQDYRVTVYDLRGHGLSGMPNQGYTTRDMAEDLYGLLEGIDVTEAHLVGHSLGGSVCLHSAVLYPEKVKSLTLADCRIHSLQPLRNPEESSFWKRRREELREKGISITEDTPKVVYKMIEELSPLVKAGIANPNALGGLLAPGGVWDPKSRAALRWKKLVTTTTFAEDIRKDAGLTRDKIMKVSHPALLTYGENSFCIDTCRALEEILVNRRTVIHPGLGHFFPTVSPELVVRNLRRFLADLENDSDVLGVTTQGMGWGAHGIVRKRTCGQSPP